VVAVFWGSCSLPPVSLLPCPLFPSHPPPCAFFSAPLLFGYLAVFPPSPQPPSPPGKGEFQSLFCRGLRPRHPCDRVGSGTGFTFGKRCRKGASPLASPGRDSQCRTGTSRIQNPQQKRLSRFCKTQNPSCHPIQQGNHGSGRQRKFPAKYFSGEVLGGLGASFKKPPTLPRSIVFPMPHGYKPDSKPTAEAAKPILQNPKSQPPSDTAREPQVRAPT